MGDAIEPSTKIERSFIPQDSKQAVEIDKMARSTIVLSLGDSAIREVAKEKVVVGLWVKFEHLYMTKSLANKLYIKKKMLSLKMIEGSSLNEHIDEFSKVCDDLNTVDKVLNDESKALLLISSLPKSYEHLVDDM